LGALGALGALNLFCSQPKVCFVTKGLSNFLS